MINIPVAIESCSIVNTRLPRLIVTLLCRNECDILEPLLDYYVNRGAAHIIATDNASTDGSVEILQRYEKAGVLTLLHESATNHDQSVWVSRMARMAAADFRADWVINVDADEFWWTDAGDLRVPLAKLGRETEGLAVERFNFPPVPRRGESFWREMLFRETRSRNALGRLLPPKICHRGNRWVEVADGNHLVRFYDRRIQTTPATQLEILHFPIRNPKQFENKIRLGAQALRRNRRIDEKVGDSWRYIYDKYLQHGKISVYLEENTLTERKIAQATREGRIVRDERLFHMLNALYAGRKQLVPA